LNNRKDSTNSPEITKKILKLYFIRKSTGVFQIVAVKNDTYQSSISNFSKISGIMCIVDFQILPDCSQRPVVIITTRDKVQ
jgi:hypothetical protein